eukprot:106496-Rhodomonas_salina.1
MARGCSASEVRVTVWCAVAGAQVPVARRPGRMPPPSNTQLESFGQGHSGVDERRLGGRWRSREQGRGERRRQEESRAGSRREEEGGGVIE